MTAHAKLSASGAHRWLHCPGSVRMEADLPDSDSQASVEGTAAHELAAWALTKGADPADYPEDDIRVQVPNAADRAQMTFAVVGDLVRVPVTDEMVKAIQDYVDFCRALPGEHFVERRLDYSPWVPDGFGTGDFVAVSETTIHSVDLKFGTGHRVDATGNPQLRLYGLGALNEFGFIYPGIKGVVTTIHQPRLDHIDTAEPIPVDDLLDWAENEVRPRAQLALSPDGPMVPGEAQCLWCKARGSCTALADHALAIAAEGFEAVAPETRERMTPEDVGRFLKELPTVEIWTKAIKAHGFHLLNQGIAVPGQKLVRGRGSREWKDAELAEKFLRRKVGVDKAYVPRKLVSPAQAEKVVGKGDKTLPKYIASVEGKPTMVPESDKRKALVIDPTEGFDAVA